MNEILFLIHIALVAFLSLVFVRLGKEMAVAFLALMAIASNLFLLKQISLFGLDVCCSDAYAVGYLFTLNLIQEFFYKKTARRAMSSVLIISVIFLLFSAIHLAYKPIGTDQLQPHFVALLSPLPRLIFSSLASFAIVQLVDIAFFAYLRKQLAGRFFALRVLTSLLLAELLDTILFSLFALSSHVHALGDIILFSTLLKGCGALLTLPFSWLAKRFIRYDPAL